MTRAQALRGARVGFVLATIGFAWWGFAGRWQEIGDALAETGPARLCGAVLGALAGLALTGVLWRNLLSAVGSRVDLRGAGAVFFVGQLGKYVPGSVWSFAAQAQLGRRYGVPVRSSVTASALFLVLHTFSGLSLGGVLAAGGAIHIDLGRAWLLLLAGAATAALAPPVLRFLGDRMSGAEVPMSLTAVDLVRSLALMTGTWACYGACLWVLVPSASLAPEDVLTAVAAFALAHAAGVMLVLAPAGLGAREAVLVALLSPVVGVPAAAAAALLARAAHTFADFALAAGAAASAARTRAREAAGVRNA
ncbi:lysylphosphatidylglycerol synthase domain-containing protein [Nocardioides sp. LHG3406-4]|uniref:lysylphosphatidylglycerol synthase domain-containing protein n=1 Tax=Nocardioides sp. LHG3406-4 TaxID=2804575 RepID=UPI003CE8D2FD